MTVTRLKVNSRPSLLSHPAIISSSNTHEYSHKQNKFTIIILNTTIILDDDALGPVEGYEEPIVEDPDESDHEEETTPTADDIVSASLASGALSEVCEVAAVMRELDDKESDLVKQFVSRGCSTSCDFGPKKTPCSMLFPVEHYQCLRATFAEMSSDELDLFVMGQIMAHCHQSTTLQGHHSSSPEQRRGTYGQFYHQGLRICQRTFLFLHNIGIKRFKNIKKSYLTNGPAVRVHGNAGKRPKHQLTFRQIKDIIQFILNYTGKKSVKYVHVHVCR